MGMACHPSCGLLATIGADRKVLVWDVDGGFCTHYFKGHKGIVLSILFHPNSTKPLVSSISESNSYLLRCFKECCAGNCSFYLSHFTQNWVSLVLSCMLNWTFWFTFTAFFWKWWYDCSSLGYIGQEMHCNHKWTSLYSDFYGCIRRWWDFAHCWKRWGKAGWIFSWSGSRFISVQII